MHNDGLDSGEVSIHAGFPNPATDKSLGSLDLNRLLIQHSASTFMFRIHGNEWEEAGVYDGDIAIVDRALDPRNTDIVLWWNDTDGEFSVSKYTAMPKDARLWGVLTATIHQFR